jgi:hypothetical protein
MAFLLFFRTTTDGMILILQGETIYTNYETELPLVFYYHPRDSDDIRRCICFIQGRCGNKPWKILHWPGRNSIGWNVWNDEQHHFQHHS